MEKQDEDKIEQETEVLDFNKPDFTFAPLKNHDWRQSGPYLICKGCELEHAIYIGMEKLMVGTDEEGKPILEIR